MNDVEALCDRIVIIDEGLAAFEGDLTALRAHADISKEVVLSYRDIRACPEVLTASGHGWAPQRQAAARFAVGHGTRPVRGAVGDLLDLRIIEAGLDEVMAQVFGKGGRRR